MQKTNQDDEKRSENDLKSFSSSSFDNEIDNEDDLGQVRLPFVSPEDIDVLHEGNNNNLGIKTG